MQNFFISDPHFGHSLVSELRGFASPHLHDEQLITAWITALPANREINMWILGDHSCGPMSAEDRALETLAHFRNTMLHKKQTLVHLHGVLGNHDSAHPMRPHSIREQRRFTNVYDSIHTSNLVSIAKQPVLLSHFPYDADSRESDRLNQWRLKDLGTPLIHGHTHATEPLSYSAQGTLQICVCVEACPDFAPISQTDIARIIRPS
ncbi:serine/threonine protein phosphatase [Corynebacterium sp. ES2775-CONJ]|uniref:serine/threonine protein phosphatase n=1 Tax=Corynebacterium sp. ES2775-CONJ TaxID=2974029 RepID=UPI002169FC7D|nr:serine/threonine protein phosphatase [Corynebacterium sp. ES2775-CONJ]MCS4490080.1 serine/threonine protein phosphatase [Corynebacterium sp. ES2775-CONJ]